MQTLNVHTIFLKHYSCLLTAAFLYVFDPSPHSVCKLCPWTWSAQTSKCSNVVSFDGRLPKKNTQRWFPTKMAPPLGRPGVYWSQVNMIQPFSKVLHPVLGLRTHSFWMGTPAAIISRNPTSANNSINENCRILSDRGNWTKWSLKEDWKCGKKYSKKGCTHHVVFVYYVHLLY